jgi:hypothetical protein
MEKVQRFICKGIFGVIALIATHIFLFFYGIDIELTWLSLLFVFVFGWPAIILIVIIYLI